MRASVYFLTVCHREVFVIKIQSFVKDGQIKRRGGLYRLVAWLPKGKRSVMK